MSPQAALMLLCATCALGQVAEPIAFGPPPIGEFVTEAERLAQQRRSDELEAITLRMVAHYPDRVETLRLRGRAHMQQGEWEQARGAYERVLARDPDDLFVRREMVLLAGILGDEQLDEKRRNYPEAAERAATALTEYCTDVLADDPNNRDALICRAYGLLRTGDTIGALEDMRQAAQLFPDDAKVLAEFGRMKLVTGEPQEALGLFEQALSLDPDNMFALDIAAGAYFQLREYANALRMLERMKRVNPMDPRAYDLAGEIYAEGLHDFDAATGQFDILIGLDPTDREAWLDKADLLRREGQPADALAVLDEAIEAGIAPEKLPEDRGTVFFTMGRYEDAIEEYTRVIELGPKASGSFIWEPYRLRALSHKHLGRYEEAWRDLHRAEELGLNSSAVEEIGDSLREQMPEPERETEGANDDDDAHR